MLLTPLGKPAQTSLGLGFPEEQVKLGHSAPTCLYHIFLSVVKIVPVSDIHTSYRKLEKKN